MKIAVTYENGMIFQHFGHTKQFKIYETTDGKSIKTEIVDTNGEGHSSLAALLSSLGVHVLICGGIGGCAKEALAAADIELRGGVVGFCDTAVEAFLAGRLVYKQDCQCNHHSHGDHNCSGGC